MSVFKRILEEKGKSNVGPTESGIENARKKLIKQFNRPSRKTTSPSGDLYTNMAGGNIPDEQKYDQLERMGKQKQPKSVSAASDVDVKSRVQASNTSARARNTQPAQRRPLGNMTKGGPIKVTTLKPSKPAPAPTKPQVVKQSDVSKKASEYREKVKRANKRGALSKQVDPILKDLKIQGQRQRELQRRMSAGYDRTITRRGEDLLKQIRADAPSRGREAMMTAQRNRAAKQPKVTELKPPKVTGGTPRVTDLAPTKRPAGIKTFAQFAKSGRTAQQKQATVKALQTPPEPKTAAQPKVKPPKSKAPTRAAVAPKVKAPKITAGGVAGGALSALGAGFDVVQGRDDAKKAGASDTRAWLRGAARAAGGLVGGSLGATGGGLVGGIAGYSAGSALADKTFTALAGATDAQKAWMKQANLASQKGTAVDKVKYRKGNQAVIYDPRVKKERIGTFDPTSGTFKAANLAKSKAYTAKNPFERLGRQFSRSNEGSGLFGLNIVKGHGLADMAKKYYADKDERERVKRVSDFKKSASTK